MKNSLFIIFEAVSSRRKDILLYISETMYSHLVPIVGTADRLIYFRTTFAGKPKTLYWWSYRAARAPPCTQELEAFLRSVPYVEKKGRKFWTHEEEEALREAVRIHGEGNWAKMKVNPNFKEILSYRDNVNLKDKWRSMSKHITNK